MKPCKTRQEAGGVQQSGDLLSKGERDQLKPRSELQTPVRLLPDGEGFTGKTHSEVPVIGKGEIHCSFFFTLSPDQFHLISFFHLNCLQILPSKSFHHLLRQLKSLKSKAKAAPRPSHNDPRVGNGNGSTMDGGKPLVALPRHLARPNLAIFCLPGGHVDPHLGSRQLPPCTILQLF